MYIKNFDDAIEIAIKNNWIEWCGASVTDNIGGVALTEKGVVLYMSIETTPTGIHVFPFKAQTSIDGVILHDKAYGKPTFDFVDRDYAITLYNSRTDDKIIRYVWKEDL